MSMVARSVISGGCVVFTFLGAVGMYALGDGVAVDAERDSGLRDVFVVARKRLFNVKLFEFCQGLIEHDVAIEHFVNYSL